MQNTIKRLFTTALALFGAAVFSGGAFATNLEALEGPVDDAGYLQLTGLMRGHLMVGHELYRQGEIEAAKTHARHPGDELYALLQPAFEARGAAGFADELAAHAEAVEAGDADAVRAAYEKVMAAIMRHEEAVQASPAVIAEVVFDLLSVAAEEYGIGIVDGKPDNAHEYQDAYGFTQVALGWAKRTGGAEFTGVAKRIGELAAMWPALVPPENVPHHASELYGAAAEVEIMTLPITRG